MILIGAGLFAAGVVPIAYERAPAWRAAAPASASGAACTLSGLAASCFIGVLIGSGAGLVPIQRQLVDPDRALALLACRAV